MKNRTQLALLLTPLALIATACPGSDGDSGAAFSKSYGGPDSDEAAVAIQTRDGGYAFAGVRDLLIDGLEGGEEIEGEAWLVKLNAAGDRIWQHSYGQISPVSERGQTFTYNAVAGASDGGAWLVGRQNEPRPFRATGDWMQDGGNVVILRLDANGDILWREVYDSGDFEPTFTLFESTGTLDETGMDIVETTDGGAYFFAWVVAEIEDEGIGRPQAGVWRGKVDSNGVLEREGTTLADSQSGTLQWFLSNEPIGVDIPRMLVLDFELGNPVLVVSHPILNRTVAFEVDPNGVQVWLRNADVYITDAIAVDDDADGQADDGIVLVGTDGGDAWAARLDSLGAIVWEETYAGFEVVSCIAERSYSSPASIHELLLGIGTFDCTAEASCESAVLLISGGTGDEIVRRNISGTGVLDVYHDQVTDRWSVCAQTSSPIRDANQVLLGAALNMVSSQAMGYSPSEAGQFSPDGSYVSIDSGPLVGTTWEFLFRRWTAGAPVQELDAYSSRRQIERVHDMLETADDGFAMLVTSSTLVDAFNPTYDWPLLIRTNEFGVPRWQRVFEGARLPHWVRGTASPREVSFIAADLLQETPDGGFAVGICTDGLPHVVRLDADGNQMWTSDSLGTTPANKPGFGTLILLADGGFLCVGPEWLTRLAADGTFVWSSSVPLEEPGFLCSAVETSEGEFVVSGWDGTAPVVARFDASGSFLWASAYPLTGFVWGYPVRLAALPDDGFALAATLFAEEDPAAGVPTQGGRNAVILKVDEDGLPEWFRVHGGLEDEVVHGLSVTKDGGLVLAGYSDSFGDRREAWILRLGFDGIVSEGCQAYLGGGMWPAAPVDLTPEVLFVNRGSFGGMNVTLADATLADGIGTPPVVARQCLGFPLLFEPPPIEESEYTLTIQFAGAGTGSVFVDIPATECTDVCSFAIPAGSTVFLQPTADPLSVFSHFDGCDQSSIEFCSVEMSSDRTVTVFFASLES